MLFSLLSSLVFAKTPQRILSTSLAGDEIILQLTKDSEKRKNILAVSTLADNSEFSTVTNEAKKIPHRAAANIEQILNLKPDLVIAASFNQPEFIHKLRKLNIPVHIMEKFQSLKDLEKHINDIGSLIDCKKEAETLILKMNQDLQSFKKNNKNKVKILPLLADRTLIGKDSLLDDVLNEMGFINLAREIGIQGWQKISEEKLIQMNPDAILTGAEEKNRKDVLFSLSQSIALKKMKALHSRLILVSPAKLGSFSPTLIEGLILSLQDAKF